MRLLVDTNVFIDFLLDRAPYGKDAKDFFFSCWQRKNQIYVTSMSLRDIEYVVSRKTHSRQIGKQVLLKTYQIATKVVGVEADDAINAMLDHEGDYEDALQMEAAERSFCDAIITNDKMGYQSCKIPVFSPAMINAIWQKDQ